MGLEDKEKPANSVRKNINLPLYDDYETREVTKVSQPESSTVSTVESYVRSLRLKATGVASSINNFNDGVAMKYNTAKAHTNGVIDFFRDEPVVWQRCGLVALAGLTGFISGYKRGGLVKLRNSLGFAGVAGAICWPKETVEAASSSFNYVREPVVQAWTEYAPGSPYWPKNTASPAPSAYYRHNKAQQDHGQSLAEDKDMYSTRGS